MYTKSNQRCVFFSAASPHCRLGLVSGLNWILLVFFKAFTGFYGLDTLKIKGLTAGRAKFKPAAPFDGAKDSGAAPYPPPHLPHDLSRNKRNQKKQPQQCSTITLEHTFQGGEPRFSRRWPGAASIVNTSPRRQRRGHSFLLRSPFKRYDRLELWLIGRFSRLYRVFFFCPFLQGSRSAGQEPILF